MTKISNVSTLTSAAAVGLVMALAATGPAKALGIGDSVELLGVGPGLSQNDQVGGGDLSSSLGYSVEVDFSFTRSASDTGLLQVNLTNNGADGSRIRAFVISLRDDIFGDGGRHGSSQVDGADDFMTNVDCAINGCKFKDSTPSYMKSFMDTHITAGAERKQSSHKGLDSDGVSEFESVTFNWDVVFDSAQEALLDTVTSFLELIQPVEAGGVEAPNEQFNTFWGVKAQSLADSDRLGGQQVADVPEPGPLAILGFGLVGLFMARRRQAARTA